LFVGNNYAFRRVIMPRHEERHAPLPSWILQLKWQCDSRWSCVLQRASGLVYFATCGRPCVPQ